MEDFRRDFVAGVSKVQTVITENAFLLSGEDSYPMLVRGLGFGEDGDIYKVRENIYDGALPENNQEVIIGRDLQEETAINIGDNVQILRPQSQPLDVKVVGFFDFKNSNLYDKSFY